MLELTRQYFPRFSARAPEFELENVLPGATSDDLEALEGELGIPLPVSYKQLLCCARGFWLMGGVVQFGEQHPFFHDFPPVEALTPQQRVVIQQKGGVWPPASHGMLCFAEFFMEADGDQVLFDVSRGLIDGEYPVMYYSHESRPPAVRTLTPTFAQFMEEFLEYRAFHQ